MTPQTYLRREGEINSLLPSFKGLLGGAREAQESQNAAPSVGDGSGSVGGAVGRPDPDDCNDAPTPQMVLDKLGKTNGYRNVDL